MSLQREQFNNRLNAIRDNQKQFRTDAITAQEKLYAKKATKLGGTAKETIGGVQGLDATKNAPNEVSLGDNACRITDGLPNLTGLKDPTTTTVSYSASLVNLNFDSAGASFDSDFVIVAAKSGGDTPTSIASTLSNMTGITPKKASGLSAIGGAGLDGVVSNATAAVKKQNNLVNDIKSSAASVASAGELSAINNVTQNVGLDKFDGVAEKLTPVASLKNTKNPQDLLSAVSNKTNISGLTADLTSAKNILDNVPSVNSLLGKVSAPTLKGGIADLVSDAQSLGSKLTNAASDLTKTIDEGLGGLLQNVAEGLTGAAKSFVNGLLPGGDTIERNEMKSILANKTSDNPAQKTLAVRDIVKNNNNVSTRMRTIISQTKETTIKNTQITIREKAIAQGIPEEEIVVAEEALAFTDAELDKLNTTISGTRVVSADMFDDAKDIDENNKRWLGRNSSDDSFTYVSSKEEMESEIRSITRDVTEVIIHATETATDKNIGAIEINNIHNKLGFDGIGYHYVIRRDGRIQRGRPVNRVGEHTEGRNSKSIGVVLVGGLNVASGTEDILSYRSSQSFTRAQYTSLEYFLSAFYKRYHGGQVFGHNDIDETELDPYFDVPDYIQAVFRKYNTVSQYGTTNTLNTGMLKPEAFNTRDVIADIGNADLVGVDGEPKTAKENVDTYGYNGAPNQTDRVATNSTPDKLAKVGIPQPVESTDPIEAEKVKEEAVSFSENIREIEEALEDPNAPEWSGEGTVYGLEDGIDLDDI